MSLRCRGSEHLRPTNGIQSARVSVAACKVSPLSTSRCISFSSRSISAAYWRRSNPSIAIWAPIAASRIDIRTIAPSSRGTTCTKPRIGLCDVRHASAHPPRNRMSSGASGSIQRPRPTKPSRTRDNTSAGVPERTSSSRSAVTYDISASLHGKCCRLSRLTTSSAPTQVAGLLLGRSSHHVASRNGAAAQGLPDNLGHERAPSACPR